MSLGRQLRDAYSRSTLFISADGLHFDIHHIVYSFVVIKDSSSIIFCVNLPVLRINPRTVPSYISKIMSDYDEYSGDEYGGDWLYVEDHYDEVVCH